MTEAEREALATLIHARTRAGDAKGRDALYAIVARLPPAEFAHVEGRVRELGGDAAVETATGRPKV